MLSKKLLKIIEDKHKLTGGHGGVYLVYLINKTGKTSQEVRKALKELKKEQKIDFHNAINGVVIKVKKCIHKILYHG